MELGHYVTAASALKGITFPSFPSSKYRRTGSIIPLGTSQSPTCNKLKLYLKTMAGRQAATVGGLALAGGVGYYLYSAGGDPKLAEKKAERASSVCRD